MQDGGEKDRTAMWSVVVGGVILTVFTIVCFMWITESLINATAG